MFTLVLGVQDRSFDAKKHTNNNFPNIVAQLLKQRSHILMGINHNLREQAFIMALAGANVAE